MPRSRPDPRLLAVAGIAVALALDLAAKNFLLGHAASWNRLVLLPGLLDTHYAWNRGISFSLFWQSGSFGSAVLAGIVFLMTIAFAISAFRTREPLLALGQGLIVGGALGNMWDRAVHGAVFDFLVVRLGSIALFVCNTADIFITLGAILLIAQIALEQRRNAG